MLAGVCCLLFVVGGLLSVVVVAAVSCCWFCYCWFCGSRDSRLKIPVSVINQIQISIFAEWPDHVESVITGGHVWWWVANQWRAVPCLCRRAERIITPEGCSAIATSQLWQMKLTEMPQPEKLFPKLMPNRIKSCFPNSVSLRTLLSWRRHHVQPRRLAKMCPGYWSREWGIGRTEDIQYTSINRLKSSTNGKQHS